MTLSRLRNVFILLLLLTIFVSAWQQKATPPSNKDGKLVVLVTWGDVDKTPANNAYVEAYGFVREYGSEKSFVLRMSHPGRYEASLPPGVYDVFVSEGTSHPRCGRFLIKSGATQSWTVNLEIDREHLLHSSGKGADGGPR
jgi:hypothetical protein